VALAEVQWGWLPHLTSRKLAVWGGSSRRLAQGCGDPKGKPVGAGEGGSGPCDDKRAGLQVVCERNR
jgi:hypothetical protein